jgi:peptidylprolyl isomerase
MKPTSSLSLLTLAASALAVSAQTTAPKPATTAAHPATAAIHHTATPAKSAGCVTVPKLSDKIPALPAGSACPKALYTITRKSDITIDYMAPFMNPALPESLGAVPASITLAYIDTKLGTGELAKPGLWYSVHYTGYLPDGTKFDSSVDRGEPISFPYGQHKVIPGWDTGFDGMRIGGKRRLFVPYQLAYGDRAQGPIPARSPLIFDVEFVAQSATQPAPKTPPAPPAKPATPPASGAPADAKPATPAPAPAASPAGAAAPPPASSSTPAASTAPATKPETK